MQDLVEIFTDDNDTSVYAGVLLVHGPALHTASKANLPAVFTDFCQVAKKRPGAIVVATCQDAGMRTFPLAVGAAPIARHRLEHIDALR